MLLSEYQKSAIRTMDNELSHREALAAYGLWLCSEAGETAKQVEKILNARDHNVRLQAMAELREELGDTLWCLATLAHLTGMDLDELGACNLAKLAKRWPNGFTRKGTNNG